MIGAWIVAGCVAGGGGPGLTVLAASSLTDAFRDLAAGFEARHPEVRVDLVLAGSQVLAAQVEQGLRAAAFASADRRHLERLAEAGLAADLAPLATNRLVVAIRAGLVPPGGFRGLAALDRIVLGSPDCPAGAYADLLLARAGERWGAAWLREVEARVASREPSVRLALAKVIVGEADAAVVYASDLAGHPELGVLDPPPDLAPEVRAWQARLVDAPEPALADAWLAWTRSPEAAAVLGRHGLEPEAP